MNIRERIEVAIGVAECDLHPVVVDAIRANVCTVVGEWLREEATSTGNGRPHPDTVFAIRDLANEIDPPKAR